MGRKCPPPDRWETVSPDPPKLSSQARSTPPEKTCSQPAKRGVEDQHHYDPAFASRVPVEEVSLVPARMSNSPAKLTASGGTSPEAPPAPLKKPGDHAAEGDGEAPPGPPEKPCSQPEEDEDEASV